MPHVHHLDPATSKGSGLGGERKPPGPLVKGCAQGLQLLLQGLVHGT